MIPNSPSTPANYTSQHPWVPHYDSGVPAEVIIPDATLQTMLTETAQQCGDRDATIFYGKRMTYLELEMASNRFAHALMNMGIQHNDRVAICLPNSPQFPIAFFGVLKAGAVVVPTNPLYTPHEMRHQMCDSGAVAIIILDTLYPALHEVRKDTPVKHVILTGVSDFLPFPLSMLYPVRQKLEQRGKPSVPASEIRSDTTIVQMRDLLATPARRSQHVALIDLPPPAQAHDIALLQYTGGTTGVAKGAMLTHRNLLANAIQCAAWNNFPRYEHHVSLAVAPFFHVYGLTVGMLMCVYEGATMVILPRFIPKDVLHAIEQYRPDLFPGIPTMYTAISREIEKRGKGDVSSIKVCLSGAAPLLHEVQERFEKLSGARVVEGYGLTEASPVTHANPLFGDRRTGTIGVPFPSTDARIIDPATGNELPHGEPGELIIQGPQVMLGYWNRPDETAKILQNGWLRTGDIATMNDDGYFTIVDRAKDMIIAGGYNIYPREVEEVLACHPAVQECVVVGVPDPYRGETVRAYVVLKDGQHATAEEIIAYCKKELAVYKVPKQVTFRAELPKSLIGKILRRVLRDEAIAEISHNNTPTT